MKTDTGVGFAAYGSEPYQRAPAPHEITGHSGLYENDKKHLVCFQIITIIMSRSLYSPRLSDDVVRALYREGRCRRMPMTRLADDLLRQSLVGSDGSGGSSTEVPPALHLCEQETAAIPIPDTDAA